MRWVLPALLALFQALPPAGGLEVSAREGLVTVRANRVPLSRILDRMAQQTGMKVTYESGPPSQQVTATIEGVAPREAVVRLMEGLGVAYVFRTDVSGQRVETLIVSDGGSSGTQAASSPPGSPPAETVDYSVDANDESADFEDSVPLEAAVPPPGQPVPDLALPGAGAPPGFAFTPPPGSVDPPPTYPTPPGFPHPVSFPN
jgi:hypothetical protein